MPRRNRLFIRGGIYHVYNRVTRGEPVFHMPAEARFWIDTVAREAHLHELKILAWCLMPNHYHLVIKTGTLPLWRAMARIQARVARHHNRTRGVVGPLWQSRYKARIVLEQSDLENLIAYVHLNPVTAGIVDDPADYERSGHRAMIGRAEPRLVDVAEALLTFDENPAVSRAMYLDRLCSVAAEVWSGECLQRLPWWRTVDDAELTMDNEVPPPEAETFEGRPLPPEEPRRPQLSLVLELFESWYGVPEGSLAGKSRTGRDSSYRCMFSTFAVCWLGFRVCDVSRLLDKAPGSVSRWIAEGHRLQRSEGEFRDSLARLRCEVDALPAGGVSETEGE
jgi:REP element-mobilizing transposase RayT